ncbi:MAG: bifunctional glutamate N-acetyltransferase/amino-acid acetyltransferase ArgJ [Pontibacterium sp.]
MAVGPSELPRFYPVSGFALGTASAGIKKPGRPDLVVMSIAEGASVAGVFTQNAFCAAPVQLCKRFLPQGDIRYFVINTGNANAGTGTEGLTHAQETCDALGQQVGVNSRQVLPFSTGVIGERLPVERIVDGLPAAVAALTESGWEDAASGIMTTDTRPKGATRRIEIDGKPVVISGISKGAGMIRPNMATMLGFAATDAAIDDTLLQQLLTKSANQSFNRITVDSDTSTNDACMLVATGKSGVEVSEDNPAALQAFTQALNSLMRELAHAIVRDGEGATKFVTVEVANAASQAEALDTAYAIAHSPLVKTALFASDPNWGRILAVVGRAGIENLDLEALKLYLGDVCIVSEGGRDRDYTEEAGQAVMNQEEIKITVDLNRGDVTETVWTTDFSHDYVSINADYRS